MSTATQPTTQQVQQAMDAFIKSPEFLALPQGRARTNAYNAYFNKITSGAAPAFGDSSGILQAIPGQPAAETAGTRIAGAAAGSVILPALLGAGAAGGTAAGGTSAASTAAGGTTAGKILTAALPVASQVLGGAAKSEQEQNNTRDKLLAEVTGTQLNRDKFATAAPSARLQNALQAALAKNYTPASVKWGGPGSGLKGEIPQYSGGAHSIEPALQDPSVKAIMDMVGPDMVAQEQRGGASGGNQDANLGLPSNFGKDSTLDKVLGGSALTASALAQILPLLTNRKAPPPVPYTDQTQDPTDIWGGMVPE